MGCSVGCWVLCEEGVKCRQKGKEKRWKQQFKVSAMLHIFIMKPCCGSSDIKRGIQLNPVCPGITGLYWMILQHMIYI